MVGYSTQVLKVSSNTRKLNVKMKPDLVLDEVVVKPKKKIFAENNPAVEMMKKSLPPRK